MRKVVDGVNPPAFSSERCCLCTRNRSAARSTDVVRTESQPFCSLNSRQSEGTRNPHFKIGKDVSGGGS